MRRKQSLTLTCLERGNEVMPEIISSSPPYLSTREVAVLLRRSLTSVYRLTRRPPDPLPARRLGGTLLFVRDEVTRWVDRQERITPLERKGATRR